MNYSMAIFLLTDDVQAVRVSYDPEEEKDQKRRGTYQEEAKILKTFNKEIKKDDLVIVETTTRHKMTVCKVEEVDVDIDYDSTYPMKWIVGVVDHENFDQIKEQEDRAIAAVKSSEVRRQRKRLREALLEDADENLKKLEVFKPDPNGNKT